MSAAHRRWIRLDADWEESPWLHELSGEAAGCWPRLLCWVKLRGAGGRCRWPSAVVLGHSWRVPSATVETLLAGGLSHGAIERDGNDLVIAKWSEFQEPDRTAADRKRRQREKEDLSRSVTRDTPVTRHATETLTLTETEKPKPPAVDHFEHTANSLAEDAHRVLGMGLWGNEFSKKFADTKSIILRTWGKTSYAEVHAAIHGLRIMVDRGDVEWLKDRKQKPLDGLEVLVKASAVVPGPDGGQMRSLFSAAVDAYHAEQAKPSPRKRGGLGKVSIDIPGAA